MYEPWKRTGSVLPLFSTIAQHPIVKQQFTYKQMLFQWFKWKNDSPNWFKIHMVPISSAFHCLSSLGAVVEPDLYCFQRIWVSLCFSFSSTGVLCLFFGQVQTTDLQQGLHVPRLGNWPGLGSCPFLHDLHPYGDGHPHHTVRWVAHWGKNNQLSV